MTPLPRFVHPSSLELYNYWNARRGARPAPYRSEIEPADIRDVLADIFILDVEQNERYVWRLAGTRICTLHCRELKGRDFLADWTGGNDEPMRSTLRTIAEKNLVAVLEVTARNSRNQSIDMEMVLMPLHVEGSREQRILGCLLPLDQPYWVGISPPTSREIVTTKLIWPSTPLRDPLHLMTASDDRPMTAANMQSANIFYLNRPGVRRVRHLMVMDGGKRQL